MKYLFMLSLFILPALSMAQEEGVDPVTECAAVLAAPPIDDILTRNEGRDFLQISRMEGRGVLLGLECSVDDLTFFLKIRDGDLKASRNQGHLGHLGQGLGFPSIIEIQRHRIASKNQRFSDCLGTDAERTLEFCFTKIEFPI